MKTIVEQFDGQTEARLREFCFQHRVKVVEKYTTQSGNAKAATKRARVSKHDGTIMRLVFDTSRRVWYNS